ncbi:Crp/Fnr family transcriptional regulator FnrL [Stakelama sediminis]|uniref:CRP/FNR family transcriptional regulator n=1 Tax=Stakelama sediminis TaxID=463200 RepID=A0A840YYG7_9SPHN|nr:Crp/Fnr family transcriptional regulator [Stakelama sediminis]MBB5718821.1 CRP/FNR family transcriptional regulator [Stakelama sediminis]
MSAVPERCLDCLVRDTALCSAMEDQELVALSAIGRRKIYPGGQVVTWSGDPNSFCANIVTGVLKVTASTPDGREQIVGLLHPGDFVGEPFAEEAPLTITAVSDTDLCLFPRESFQRTMDEHPRMEKLLLRRTMASLTQAQQRLLALGRRNAGEKIAGFLIDLCDRMAPDAEGPVEIDLPISRGEMADYLGLTIETVSRQLTGLRRDGVVSFEKGNRHFRVLDRARLEHLADPE